MGFSARPSFHDSRPAVVDVVARDDWVETRLTRNLMRNAKSGLHSVALITPVVVMVLYNEVSHIALFGWALAAMLMVVGRYRLVSLYRRDYADAGAQQQRAFIARYSWTWTLSAVVWGASVFLYFRKVPVYDQFVCLLVLVGMAGFAVGAFTACLRCFVGYINGLTFTMLAAMVWSLAVDRPLPGAVAPYALVLLVLIYWAILRTGGKRLNRVQRSNLELQFDNAQLISSLTEKTHTALEAVEAKNRFIASAAHDLRQPVHALSLYADWLVAEPELVLQIAPKIVRSTYAVNELFNSLFDLARLDASAVKVNWQRVDLPSLVDELQLQYAPLAHDKGLDLRTHVMEAEVLSDPVLLKRLLGNLLSNAVRHTERGGVLLAVRRCEEGWRVEVWDTGVGVAPEHQEAIFQEFYRVARHNGTEEGFGLGLAIASRLCDALNHRLTMRSQLERGTMFRLEMQAFDDGSAPAQSLDQKP